MGNKNHSLQVSSQKTEIRRLRTKPFIPTLCSQDLLHHLWVPCVHRSQALKQFPGKNHYFWIKFNSVCIYEGKDLTVGVGCRWSRAFLLMKCWVIQLETIWSVLFVGPDSMWWRSNNCSVRSREQALGYRRSLPIIMHHTFWHDYCFSWNRGFFFPVWIQYPHRKFITISRRC